MKPSLSFTLMSVSLGLLIPQEVFAQEMANGRDVYGPCAACHGANGEGGKQGEYPRLAGQNPNYAVNQLKAFQSRKRYNMPMFPYTEPRELSETDMKDVSAFLASISLPAKAPVFKDTDSALDRLLAMEKVLIVPRAEGDVEKGGKTFKQRCASCHGRYAQGKKDFPMLVGQYPTYLQRQFDAFLRGARIHEKKSGGPGVIGKLQPKDLTDVLAWLTSIQGQEHKTEPEPEPPPEE